MTSRRIVALVGALPIAASCGSSHGMPDARDAAIDASADTHDATASDADAGDERDAQALDAGPPGPVIALSGISAQTCAIRESGQVWCWGLEVAPEPDWFRTTPMPPTFIGISDAVSISSGLGHTCVARRTGAVSCWGWSNDGGQIGDGTTEPRGVPVDVVGLTDAVSVGLGDAHSCAVRRDGRASCWGSNYFGQLGDGTTTARSTPVEVLGLTGVVQIDGGQWTTCALTADGRVYCWGHVDDSTERLQPEEPVAGLERVAEVRGQVEPMCVRSEAADVLCWGPTAFTAYSLTPMPIAALHGSRGLAVGGKVVCSISLDEDVLCVGLHLGSRDGEESPPDMPQRMGLSEVVALTTTSEWAVASACAATRAGAVFCWGANRLGALGDGTFEPRSSPVEVRGL